MWTRKKIDTIPERPDEEDLENSDRVSRHNNMQRNKIDLILDQHMPKQNDFNFLSNQNVNRIPNKLLGLNSDIKSKYNNTLSKNHSKTEIRSFRGNIIENSEGSKVKRSNSFQFIKMDTWEIADEFPEFIVKFEETKENLKTNECKNDETNIKKFNSIESLTNSEKIRFKEAWNYISSLNLSEEKNNIKEEDFSNYNCFKKIYLKCSNKFILNCELLEERKLVFAIAKINLNYNDEHHLRMIKTLYKSLTGEVECPSIGSNMWTKIGFQSNDPHTDLRCTGIFSILQTLALLDKLHLYSKEIYNYSKLDNFHFPLLCVLINLSSFCLSALREGYLIPACNNTYSIIQTLNEYYFGMIDHFFTIYRNSKQTCDQINTILQSINKFSKKNPETILKLANNLKTKYPLVNKDSMSLEDDFSCNINSNYNNDNK